MLDDLYALEWMICGPECKMKSVRHQRGRLSDIRQDRPGLAARIGGFLGEMLFVFGTMPIRRYRRPV